jgi:hypothetical protein
MVHFPLDVTSPSLLPHPTASTTAMQHLEGRQISRLILQRHECSWPKQRNHLGKLDLVVGHVVAAD